LNSFGLTLTRNLAFLGKFQKQGRSIKPDLEAWKEWIGDKPVWYLGHFARVNYGTDPQTLKDPEARAKANRNDI
jgi:hypothetical protein